ncbi:MAG TPA: DUF2199 domain-containing protein [Hanamia sp.]|nr:DUF2199 domain-containing protein [Hanamia sp.]
MLFNCSVCGQVHEGFPALGFDAPYFYHNLSDIEKQEIAELSDDFCIIRYPNQTDHFIRVVLNQKIIDFPETLQYGVWVSLSEKSFNDYKEHYNSTDHLTTYFGYLCNQLPDYENTLSIRTNVQTAADNNRPEIFPHDDQIDNPFVRDYFEGISREEAERRIHAAYGSDID